MVWDAPLFERRTEATRPRKHRDVLFYIPWASPLLAEGGPSAAGGAETQVLLLARELARRGYAVGIVANADRPLRAQVDGVDVIEQPLPRTRLPLIRTLIFYVQMLSLLRANPARVLVQRAACIHTFLVAVAARLLQRKFVYASAGVHDFAPERWEPPRRLIRWAFETGFRLADQVVVQTGEQVQLCRAYFGREPELIKSIAEPARAQASPPEAFLWMGALTRYKQPLALVELAQALPEVRFWMITYPRTVPEQHELFDMLSRAAENLSNLDLLPPRSRAELGPLIERAVAVVNTSATEGMPNVFLEGWSRGVPALALHHDPDGVLERERLGGFARGSFDRMICLARTQWERREDRLEQRSRCRAYVASEHSLQHVADRWVEVLGL